MAKSDERMTSGQVADLLGVDRSTISRLPKERLKFTRTPGGQRRYLRSDVLAYAREDLGLDLPDDDEPGTDT